MRKKFTLIELIIVIVVIGILAAMALPKFNNVVRDAKTSAMINDAEILEKAMVLYYQKYDKLPLLNEDQDLIALSNSISLVKMVQAEEIVNDDTKTIYTSLQKTLEHYNDSEENLYRIDIKEINNSLSKKLKYGTKKEDKDFYVYSTKTNNVYYYNVMINGEGEIQHSEFNTKLKETTLIDKKESYSLDPSKVVINNKPIVELTTNLEELTADSIIKWEYIFTDEDKEPTKISFILNDVEYDDFSKIPTKLEEDNYTIKLKMQDSKGLWSDEINDFFEISSKSKFDGLFYVPLGTTAKGSSTYAPGYASFAIDRILSKDDRWRPGGNNGTLILEFPKPTKIKGVSIYQATSYVTDFSCEVYEKVDENWISLGKGVHKSISGNIPNLTSNIEFREDKYKELKFVFKNNNSSWINIHEIFLVK